MPLTSPRLGCGSIMGEFCGQGTRAISFHPSADECCTGRSCDCVLCRPAQTDEDGDLVDMYGNKRAACAVVPVVKKHPFSGMLSFNISPQGFFKFVGMEEDPSRALAEEMMDVVTDVTYSHRWSVGDVVLVDNRSMIHTAPPGQPPHDRMQPLDPRLFRRIRPQSAQPTRPVLHQSWQTQRDAVAPRL